MHDDEIKKSISSKCCFLFTGAGVCRDASLPDWNGFINQAIESLQKSGAITSEDQRYFLSVLTDSKKIPQVFDLLLSKINRKDLLLVLRSILSTDRESVTINTLRSLVFRGVITTNLDKITNQIISDKKPWILSNSVDHLRNIDVAISSGDQFLFKIHGDIDDISGTEEEVVNAGAPFAVLSKADYTYYQTTRKNYIQAALHTVLTHGPVLFVGFSFNDPDINAVLDFLNKHLRFSHKSWYVGLKGSDKPHLPENVEFISPIKEWSELPAWLASLNIDASKVPPVCTVAYVKINEQEKESLIAISDFLNTIEADDANIKTIASVLVPHLIRNTVLERTWINQFISEMLSIGPQWATSYTDAAIGALLRLGVIRIDDSNSRIHAKPQIELLHQKAQSQNAEDVGKFTKSMRKRFSLSPIKIEESFYSNYVGALLDLSMQYGEQLANWIHNKVSADVSRDAVKQVIDSHFEDAREQFYAYELTELIFNDPTPEEVPYLYRIISSALLLNSVKLKPEAAKYLRESISSYEIYLDTNILLPLVIKEHDNHSWIASIIKASRDAGVKFYVIDDYLEEVDGHLGLARDFVREYGESIVKLNQYSIATGSSANCFVNGYLNTSKNRKISWALYASNYTRAKIRELLGKIGVIIESVKKDQFDATTYSRVKSAIDKEWAKRQYYAERNPALNEHDTKQYLYIYQKREDKRKINVEDNIWFLSYEAIFELIYKLDAQYWRKPPTFKLPAWATFVDSYAAVSNSELKRKDVLKAIISNSSSVYDMPDPLTIVKKKAFGQRPISKEELESLKTAMSDGTILARFEKAQKALVHRNRETYHSDEFRQSTDELVSEIKKDQAEIIARLKDQLRREKKVIEEKDAEIIKLGTRKPEKKKKRKYHKKK